jgi:hypothetical protein
MFFRTSTRLSAGSFRAQPPPWTSVVKRGAVMDDLLSCAFMDDFEAGVDMNTIDRDYVGRRAAVAAGAFVPVTASPPA